MRSNRPAPVAVRRIDTAREQLLQIHAPNSGMAVPDSRLDVRHAMGDVGSTQTAVELETEHDDDLFRTDVHGGRTRHGVHTRFLERLVADRRRELGLCSFPDEQSVGLHEKHDGHRADHDADGDGRDAIEERFSERVTQVDAEESEGEPQKVRRVLEHDAEDRGILAIANGSPVPATPGVLSENTAAIEAKIARRDSEPAVTANARELTRRM